MRLVSTYGDLNSVCCAKFNVEGGLEDEVDCTSCAWFGTFLDSRIGMLGMSGDKPVD